MTDEPSPRFDPRFNPAFQPGFEAGSDDAGSPPPRPMSPPQRLSAVGAPPTPLAPPTRSRPAADPASLSRPPGGSPPDGATGRGDTAAGGVVSLGRDGGAVDGGRDGGRDNAHGDDFADSDARSEPAPVTLPLAAQLRNPFLGVLAGLAVLFVVSGAWLFARTYAAFNDAGSFSTQGDFVALETLMRTSPLIIILGVGVAIGVIFLLAVGWRPRK